MKYILAEYKRNSISNLYNLTKERVNRTSAVYFIRRRPNIIDLDKVIKNYKLKLI